jgi:flagellar M-ring protein FliF
MAIDVQKSVAGVKGKLAAFTTAQLVIIGLLAAVGLIAAGAFLRWVTAPSYDVLLAGLDPADAAAVTQHLETEGVEYQLAAGGATVMVPSADLQAQRIAVAAAGLPEGSTQGYELLDAQGMTSSSFQQEVAYQRALEGELAKTLGEMKDVRSATVHLAVPEDELYTDEQKPVRASVLLDTAGTLPNDSVEAVQRLVASGVPNLEPEAVTVSDTKGRLLSSDSAAGLSSSQLEAEQAIEDAAAARADTMLASVLGPDRAVVRVNAELDTAERSTESETYDPQQTAVLRRQAAKENYEAEGMAPGGVVSVPDPLYPEAAADGTSTYAKEEGNEEFGVSREVQRETQAAGALKRLSVAVMVDENAVGLPTDAVLTELVSNAVGVDAARGDTISLAAVPFQTPDEAPAEPAAKEWTGPLGTGVAATVLLAIAAVFLRAVRRGKVDELPVAALEADVQPVDLEPQALEAAVAPAALEAAPRDEFDETQVLNLVESRPDEVTALIRGWLSEPAESGKKK